MKTKKLEAVEALHQKRAQQQQDLNVMEQDSHKRVKETQTLKQQIMQQQTTTTLDDATTTATENQTTES